MAKEDPPEVTFVVLAYNHERYIGECLQSILHLEGDTSFEIIVVNDASTDNTAECIEAIRDPRLRVVHHAVNQGHIATVTDGLKLARGQWVARIDGDDRYQPHFLKESLSVLERNPEVGLLYADAAIIDSSGNFTGQPSSQFHDADFKGNELLTLLSLNYICSPTLIAKREAWLETLPIPPGLAFHDWYFTLMMARRHTFYYLHKILSDYRVHPGNLHSLIARNKTEETSIFRVLDQIYREEEIDPVLQRVKERAKRQVYGAHYETLGTKYFGFQMHQDARRCYAEALWRRPSYLSDWTFVRHAAASALSPEIYERVKRWWKSISCRQEKAG